MDMERNDNFMASLGVETYRVGGSVRDEILGRPSKDADYVVFGASMEAVYKALDRAGNAKITPLKLRDGRQGGWRYGGIEIMLPRTEVAREPEPGENTHRAFDIVIDPGLTLADDAIRRDFTFNALYKIIAHPDNLNTQVTGPGGIAYENIVDPLGGLEDLQRKMVRTTHRTSFRDDPLRTLRALRFVSTLGYDLHHDTMIEMIAYSDAVTGLSAKGYASGTVFTELCKILMGDDVRKSLRLARDTGVLAVVLPEIAAILGHDPDSRYHDLTTDEHTFAALHTAAHVDAPLRVRLALLFHDSGKPASQWRGEDGKLHFYANGETEDHEVVSERLWRDAAERLNVDSRTREYVATLIREHMVGLTGKFKASKVRQMRVKYGDDMLRDLLLHRACDANAKNKANPEHLRRVGMMEAARQEAADAGIPATVKDLEVTGKDAAEAGLRGPAIGEALRAILHQVASQPNDKMLSREWQLEQLCMSK